MAYTQAKHCAAPVGFSGEAGKEILWAQIAGESPIFNVKGINWRGARMPVRLANEFIYFNFAKTYGLPMPAGQVLETDRGLHWGTEVLPGRVPLTKFSVEPSETEMALVQRSFTEDPVMLQHHLLAILMDVVLLNSDRPSWNILKIEKGGMVKFCYFDHDRTCGWHGDAHPTRLTNIDGVAELSRHIDRYVGCAKLNRLAFALAKPKQFNAIFDGLKLESASLSNVQTGLPDDWRGDLGPINDMLIAWWNYLRANFHDYISQKIRSV
jgi:hypothetical protein